MTSASPALRLIEFWQSPRQTIPPHVLDRAKYCLLDALGCGPPGVDTSRVVDAVSRLDTLNSIRNFTALLR